jgi:hypothetical protein
VRAVAPEVALARLQSLPGVVLLTMSAVFGRDLPGVRRPRPPRVDAHRREPWRF